MTDLYPVLNSPREINNKFTILCMVLGVMFLPIAAQAQNLTISTSGNTGTSGTNWSITGNVLSVAANGTANIHPDVITTHLNDTGDLVINLPPESGTPRHVVINNTIAYTGANNRTLTFKSANDISISSGIEITSSNAALNIVFRAAMASVTPDNGSVTFTSAVINTNGGHLWVGGGSTDATWNGLTVGNAAARTWAGADEGVTISGGSFTTNGGHISINGRAHHTGVNFGQSVGVHINGASIASQAGNIDIVGSINGKFETGAGVMIWNTTASTTITSTTGTITITGTGSDQSSTANSWRHGTIIYADTHPVEISSVSGAITVDGSADFTNNTSPDMEGTTLLSDYANGLKITSQSGSITIRGANTQEADGQASNAIRFTTVDLSNAIRIGFDGTNAYSGNILIEGNSIYQRVTNTGAGSIAIQTSGTLTIQPTGNSFTYMRAGNAGTLTYDDDWNFGTDLSGLTLGKTTTTTAISLSNALSVAGPITLHGGSVTLNASLTSTTSSTITINATTNFGTSDTRKTISTAGGDIIIHADKDANGSGQLDLDFLTLNPGSGNTIIRGESFLWSTAELTHKPYINGTGSFIFEPSDAAFAAQVRSIWFYIDQDNNGISGVTWGKVGNTADMRHDLANTIAGPVSVYAGTIRMEENLTLSAAGADVLLQATGSINLDASKTIQTNGGDITFRSNANGTAVSTTSAIALFSNSALLSQGGNITLGGNFNGAQGNGLYATGTNYVGVVLEGATLTAAGGDILIYGKSSTSYNDGIRMRGNLTTTGTGTISLYGEAYGGNNGSNYFGGLTFGDEAGSTIETENGNLTLHGLLTNTQSSNTGALNFYRSGGAAGQTRHINLLSQTGDILITGDAGNLSYGIGHSSWGNVYIGSPSNGSYTASGNVVFSYSRLQGAVSNGFRVKTTGAVTYQPTASASSFTQAQTLPQNANYVLAESASSLTIGKPGNTANITMEATALGAPITIYSGALAINGTLSATTADINLHASGAVTQTAPIIANGLALHGAGTFTLNNTSNNVVTIAGGESAARLGSLSFTDGSGGLAINSVGIRTGVFTTGTMLIETTTGDITLAQNLNTSSTSADAIRINAGKSSAIQQTSGGQILVSGSPVITTGANGISKFYSGLERSSTGLTTLVGGSANVRVNADETTASFTPALAGNNAYAIYRAELGGGDLTIVAAGGDAEGTTWEYNNGVIATLTSPVSLLNTTLESKFATASVTIQANKVTFSSDVNNTTANDFSVHARTHIENTVATTITTQGGDVLLATNVDDATDNESTTNGSINLRYGLTVTTNGGDITLGGGNTSGSDYAFGSSIESRTEGLRIDLILNLNSGGGNIQMKGKSYARSTSEFMGASGIGFYFFTAPATINSGTGTILIDGYSQTTGSTYSAGVMLQVNNAANPLTITSANTTADAIKIIAKAVGTSGQNFALETEATSPLNIYATGTGGGILISSSTNRANFWDVVFRGSTNILASSGPIQLLGAQNGGQANGRFFISNPMYIGSKAGTPVTSSTSSITIQYDYYDYSGHIPHVGTNGAVVWQPATTSYSGWVYTSWFNWNHNSQVMSSLTIGKPGNTAQIEHNTPITVAGPITMYGGVLSLGANFTSSANGDLFFKSISNANNCIINGATITKSGGTGTLTMQGHARVSNTGTITTSGGGVLNVVMWSDFDNTNNDGGVSQMGSITTNGGHVWLGGSNSNGGSYSWNGLTVGDGPSIGSSGYNSNAMDLFGSVTTNGGDFLTWAGNSSVGTSGIVTNAGHIINVGTGDIVLITPYLLGEGPSLFFKQSGGTFTLAPNGGSFPGGFNWDGYQQTVAGVGNGYNFGGNFNYLWLENISSLKSLTIGRYDGMSSGGTPVDIANSSNITVSSNTTIDGPINLYGGVISINANLTTTNSGDISFYTDNALGGLSSARSLNAAGSFNFMPRSSSFSSAVSYPFTNLSVTSTGLQIGSQTNSATLTFGATTTVSGPIWAYAGSMAINAAVTATNNVINLHATGTVTQNASGSLTANSLGLHGTGTFTLTSTANNVATLAGGNSTTRLGSLNYLDASGGLTVGTVSNTGITSSGVIEVATLSGYLDVTEPVVSTLATGDAIKLYADKDALAGSNGDGHIKVSGNGAFTPEAGARALMYSGVLSESTGLVAAVGGDANVRTNISATTNLATISPALAPTGKYALFRISNSTNDANLSAISFSSGTLSPTFSAATTSYTLTVANNVSSITVSPSVSNPNSTITVNGTAVANGQASGAINLVIGTSTITIVVTSQDQTTTKTYVIAAVRSLGTPSISSISPAFAGNGTTVTIRGSQFTGVNVVKFGNVNATSLTVVSDSVITAVVGAAKSGAVFVQNSVGSDSKNLFTYKIVEYAFENNLEDQTAANKDGTGMTYPTGGVISYGDGVDGKAVCFDGKSYMKLPDSLITKLASNFTISLRFKTSKPGIILGYQNQAPGTAPSNFIPIIMVKSDGKLSGTLWTGSALEALSTQRVDDGNWHKVDMTAGPNTVTIYIDGVQAATRSGAQVIHLDMILNQLGMGYLTGYDLTLTEWQGLRGCIDNFAIMDRELTLSELQTVTKLPVPTITSFTPASGSTNDEITITGTYLRGATEVKIGGTKAMNLKIDSDTQIKATVSTGTTGIVSVLTAAGTATSSQSFTYVVTLPPVLSVTAPTGKSLITDPGTGSQTLSVYVVDNETFVADFAADKSVSWDLADGLNKSLFTIDVDGKLNLLSPVRPGSYQVVVRALDPNGNSARVLVTVTREKQALRITAENKTKVYGTSDPALTYQVTGLLTGDNLTGTLSRATGETVGEYSILQGSLAVSAPNDYVLSYTPAALTVTRKPLSVKGKTGVVKTYDATAMMPSSETGVQPLEGVVTGDTLTVTGKPVFSQSNAGTDLAITQGAVVLTGTKAPNYEITWTNGSGTINKATLSVKVNSDAKFITTSDVNGFAGVTISGYVGADEEAVVNFSQLAITRSNNTIQTAGVYPGVLLATGLSATNYTFTYTAGDFTIVPADQLLVRLAPATARYGNDPAYAVTSASYYNSAGTQVVSLTSNVTVTGNQIKLTDGAGGTAQFNISVKNPSLSTGAKLKAGNYTLEASSIAESSPNFSNVVTLVGALTITRSTLNAAVTVGKSKPYDGNRRMIGLTLGLTGAFTGDVVTATGEGTFATKMVSTNKEYTVTGILLAGADAANYQLSTGTQFSASDGAITPLTVTLAGALGISKAYDATTAMPNGQKGYQNPSGILAGDQVTIAGSPLFSQANPGTNVAIQKATVSLSGADASNYALTWSNGSGNITSAKLIVRANDDAKFVSEADPSGYAGISVSGFSGSDNMSIVNVSGLTITRSNAGVNTAGVYAGVLVPSGVSAPNYQIEYQPGNFVISPADQLKVEMKPASIQYGGTPVYEVAQAAYYSSSGSQLVDLTEEVSIEGTRVTVRDNAGGQAQFTLAPKDAKRSTGGHLNVGAYILQAGDVTKVSLNFSNTIIVTGALTVNTKAVTTSVVNGKKKAYDGSDSMSGLSLSLTGKQDGDELTVSGIGKYSTKTAGSSKAYTIQNVALSGKDLANYTLPASTLSGTDGEITKLPLAITITAQDKLYDGTTTVLTSATNNRRAGDAVAMTYSAAFSSKNAGSLIPVNITNLTLTGEDAPNYEPQANSPLANITARKVNITPIPGQMKERGAPEPDSLRYTLSPVLVTGDKLSGKLGRQTGEAVGLYPITLGSLSGEGNYELSVLPVNFEIFERVPPVLSLAGPNGKEIKKDPNTGLFQVELAIAEKTTLVAEFKANEPVTWSISGGRDQALFLMDPSGKLNLKAPVASGLYVVIVQATDKAGATTEVLVWITIQGVDNTAPVITGPSGSAGAQNSATALQENRIPVFVFLANERVTWSIAGGSDAAVFTFGADTLRFRTAPDFEKPTDSDQNNIYSVVVKATDGAGNNSQQTVQITVTDIDDTRPLITGPSGGAGAQTSGVSIPENKKAIHTFKANESVTWAIQGGDDAGLFSFTQDSLAFKVAPDFEKPADKDKNNLYDVVVKATDPAGNFSEQRVTVTITDVDDTSPVITGPGGVAGAESSSVSVPENKRGVALFRANKPVSWSITGGSDASLFSFKSDSLLFTTAPDFEKPADQDKNNQYLVVVRARDLAGNFSEQRLTVTVTDLDDTKPVITGPGGVAGADSSAVVMPENKKSVAAFKANESVQWSIRGGPDAGLFDFAADSLVFRSPPDFELPSDQDKNNRYSLIIRATDPAGNFSEQKVGVTITDVFEVDTRPIPENFVLEGNYPNPFRGQTTIPIQIPVASLVTIELFDFTGKQVKLLVNNKNMSAGRHLVSLDARDLASDLYIIRMTVRMENGEVLRRSMSTTVFNH